MSGRKTQGSNDVRKVITSSLISGYGRGYSELLGRWYDFNRGNKWRKTIIERFEKFYLDREAQMLEGEERYNSKLLSLL